jgi:glycosyltransferase involved in cell wall biosynthesis
MGDKIKIVHIITLLELGGAQRTALTIVENLDKSRFETVLFCGRGGLLDLEALKSNIRVTFIPGLNRPIRPLRDVVAFLCLVHSLRRERPQVVHTHSSKAGVLGRLAAWVAGVPRIVHTVHGFGFTPQQPAWVRALFVWIEQRLATITHTLVFVSKANQEEAVQRKIGSADRSALIRAAVPLKEYLSLSRHREGIPGFSLSADDRLVTTVGPFKPQKNLLDFVRAAERVLAHHGSVRFLIVGDGDGRSDLEKAIQRAGLTDRVLLAGWRKDGPALLARTDIFCMTSLWEGLPMALVEAMAAGLPCVVNAVDGCRDVVENGVTGFLTPPGHYQETADKIIYLLDHLEEARALGQRARGSVGPEFDCARMIEQHETLYERLLASKK